jgi:hypothetical protein
MAGGVEPNRHILDADHFAQAGLLGRTGMIGTIADRHDVERFRRRQHMAVAGAGMIGMAMGDQAPGRRRAPDR